ncbi:hypothetical protein PAL_GLEAN10001804 [Pteropus alecto]|uniref:Uncharacterized protein n=1 Tax=Pteropus alecto TaxID=9402 RepID=L5L820_PTEAL|nr:hypothetical protein PAL_GLEAN10001804 [Pteropus alecto]
MDSICAEACLLRHGAPRVMGTRPLLSAPPHVALRSGSPGMARPSGVRGPAHSRSFSRDSKRTCWFQSLAPAPQPTCTLCPPPPGKPQPGSPGPEPPERGPPKQGSQPTLSAPAQRQWFSRHPASSETCRTPSVDMAER